MHKVSDAGMQAILLRNIADAPRGFRLGYASDTPNHPHGGPPVSNSDRLLVRAYRALVAAGYVTEKRTGFRAANVYTSIYRLTDAGRAAAQKADNTTE